MESGTSTSILRFRLISVTICKLLNLPGRNQCLISDASLSPRLLLQGYYGSTTADLKTINIPVWPHSFFCTMQCWWSYPEILLLKGVSLWSEEQHSGKRGHEAAPLYAVRTGMAALLRPVLLRAADSRPLVLPKTLLLFPTSGTHATAWDWFLSKSAQGL